LLNKKVIIFKDILLKKLNTRYLFIEFLFNSKLRYWFIRS
jgi:hypothetical protein